MAAGDSRKKRVFIDCRSRRGSSAERCLSVLSWNEPSAPILVGVERRPELSLHASLGWLVLCYCCWWSTIAGFICFLITVAWPITPRFLVPHWKHWLDLPPGGIDELLASQGSGKIMPQKNTLGAFSQNYSAVRNTVNIDVQRYWVPLVAFSKESPDVRCSYCICMVVGYLGDASPFCPFSEKDYYYPCLHAASVHIQVTAT